MKPRADQALNIKTRNGLVYQVRVTMAAPGYTPKIPVLLPGDSVINRPVKIAQRYRITCVSWAILRGFCEDVDGLNVMKGPHFENAPELPERVNTGC